MISSSMVGREASSLSLSVGAISCAVAKFLRMRVVQYVAELPIVSSLCVGVSVWSCIESLSKSEVDSADAEAMLNFVYVWGVRASGRDLYIRFDRGVKDYLLTND